MGRSKQPHDNLEDGIPGLKFEVDSVLGANDPKKLIKSRQRVAEHGEVFTPSWLVEDMLDLVKIESERIDSRFLEPACGSGNFLKHVLSRKLSTVQARYGKSVFERRHQALFSLMCIYGIELLRDNVQECRATLLAFYADYLKVEKEDIWYRAAEAVLQVNILQGDALTLTATDGQHIELPEWGYLGSGKFQRRDFRYDTLTRRSSMQRSGFELFDGSHLFIPTRTYPKMTTEEIAR